ncbi:MAG TPA: MFS transporter [Actinomycetota bacterium]|nr:MFS transporter [Actinomycetota bacterium]
MAKSTKGRRKAPPRTKRRDTDDEPLEAVELGTETELRRSVEPALPPPEPEVVATPDAHVGFFRAGLRQIGRTLKEASQWGALRATPYGLVPILTLSILAGFRGFNDRIFGLVLPDMVQELDLNVVGLLTAQNLFGFFVVFAALGLSHLLDRVRRVPFTGVGNIVNGLGGLTIPHVKTVAPIAGLSASELVGRNLSLAPDVPLVNDYYPPETRGRAFALYTMLFYLGFYGSPWIIGNIATRWGWRTPFYLFAPVLVLGGIVALLVLREPIRGYMERRSLGIKESEARQAEPPPSLGQSWRTIWGIRTMRRLFVSEIFGRAGDGLYGAVYVFFIFEEYGYDASARGKLLGFTGLFAVVGGFFGGGLVDTIMRRKPQNALILSGVYQIVRALALGLTALRPAPGVLWAMGALFGFGLAMTGPGREVFKGLILPAHVRAFGATMTFLGAVPSIIIEQPFIFRIPDWGFSGVMAASVPLYLISALLDIYAAGTFDRDRRSALASQAASVEYKRAKKAGELKLLVCRDVMVEYDGVQVLFGVDFDVADGEIVALLGTNGAGKSTLLRAISGSHGASSGAVVYDGREITFVPAHEIAGRGIAHAPGGRGIFPSLTVRENLELGKWLHTHAVRDADLDEEPRPLADVDMKDVLEIFPALKDRMDALGGQLSGGEQQMVSLAQAFLARPRLLMIDELSLGLSPAVVQELLECVRRIHKRGVTLIVVEQSVNVALTIAERAVFMEKGEVKFIGPTKDLLRRPDILRAVYVKGTGALVSAPDTARAEQRRRAALENARPVLEVEGLSKSFGGVKAVDNVSFALREGEVLGLIGPNGAGKTTIFDLISGFLKPDAGKVIFDANDVTSLGPDERAKLQLIRRFQDAKLFPSLTVYETLLVALDRRHQARNMVLTALQAPQARQSERRLRSRADQLIELLELGAFRDKFIKELSTGLRRITDIACMLATEPKVLLLDEPSSGIAQAEAESLGPLLRRVRVETGCSILIIEHDMPLISRVADELLALVQGAVVTRGAPDKVLNDKRVIEAYLGTSEASIKRSGVVVT